MTDDASNMISPKALVSMDQHTASMPQPSEAVFYGLDFDTAGHDVAFRYTATTKWGGLTGRQDFISKMANLIVREDGDIGNKPPKRTRDTNAGPAGRSKDTLLSVNFQKGPLSYIVLKLNPKRNWQFSRISAPFTMDAKDQNTGRLLEARRFDAFGKIVENSVASDGCQFAYFIVDPSKFKVDAQGGFQHHFNIHIDLLEMDGSTIDNRVPIIIDPDVRHPGGNSGP